MPCSTIKTSDKTSDCIFHEAISHCRWKKTLYPVLDTLKLDDYKDKTFEEIIIAIHRKCSILYGLGQLTMYDITSAICRYHNININKIYIIGGGPKRAIKLLSISHKRHIITHNIRVNYVDICDVIKAFKINNYKLVKQRSGDDYESYLCNWQKDV